MVLRTVSKNTLNKSFNRFYNKIVLAKYFSVTCYKITFTQEWYISFKCLKLEYKHSLKYV